MPFLHLFEQRLSSAQDERINHQPELIDQAQVHQTGYQRGAAEHQSDPGGFPAADVREAAGALAELLGEVAPEEVLDAIFDSFCIGK